MYVTDCPRCGAKDITFDLKSDVYLGRYGGEHRWETFSACRHCKKSTVFVLDENPAVPEFVRNKPPSDVKWPGSLNAYFDRRGFIGIKDRAINNPPDHVPSSIRDAFIEASTCISVECWNAAAAMFRLCLDQATAPLLPAEGSPNGPNSRTRRNLGLRLPWLFEQGLLPKELQDLSDCIREDGNDGAHARGNLTQADAEELLDFAVALLERLYTEPERLRLAKERRAARRSPPES